ncbi:MAG: autoinducer 2 ABC transporter substrate-binding protein [Vallitaleaceae bacterium]|jgi:rhamnose transport system substrate-binding protein|nr:autoinducer 2 ABC transporter substrate-binding protein [Vallitaleaceae bacterium]
MFNWKIYRGLVCVIILSLALTGCFEGIDMKDDSVITIAMIPKIIDIPYFDTCADGATKVASKYGYELIYTGPTTADAASQVNIIQEMIYKKVDVIAIAPVDPEAVKPILMQAREAGIIVVTYDADASKDSRDVFVSQVSAENLGRHIMDNVANLIGEEGAFAIITASMTADNQNTWINWIEQQNEDVYPLIELLTVIPTDEDQQKAYANTRNLINAYPELDAILAMSTEAGPAAAKAIEAMGETENVQLYCLSMPNAMRNYVKNGSADLVTLWDPHRLGSLTMEIIHALIEEQILADGSDYADFENIQYDEVDKIIIMGEPLDFDFSNIDDYDF